MSLLDPSVLTITTSTLFGSDLRRSKDLQIGKITPTIQRFQFLVSFGLDSSTPNSYWAYDFIWIVFSNINKFDRRKIPNGSEEWTTFGAGFGNWYRKYYHTNWYRKYLREPTGADEICQKLCMEN